MPPKNDWNAYRELFLHEMKENGKQFNNMATALEALREDIAAIKVDVGGLKVKAAITGAIAGVIGTGLMSMVIRFLH